MATLEVKVVDEQAGGGVGHNRSLGRLDIAAAGGCLILNSYLLKWVQPDQNFTADLSAIFGALILALPIFIVTVKDLVKGKSTVNQASITGESMPVDKDEEDDVFAGTQNLTGVIDVKVTKVGKDTTLGKVKEMILAAETSKPPIVRGIDRYAGYYIPTIIMITALRHRSHIAYGQSHHCPLQQRKAITHRRGTYLIQHTAPGFRRECDYERISGIFQQMQNRFGFHISTD